MGAITVWVDWHWVEAVDREFEAVGLRRLRVGEWHLVLA
jgi:hypothetical protein